MDDCSDEDMATLASAPRPRPKTPVGQSVPDDHDDWTLEQLRGQPLPNAEAIVYVLAYARQRKLFVDVAQDVVEANDIRHRIERAQLRQSGKRGVTPLYWVYAECHPSEASAQQRCAEIKAMPHAWQRRIIDRFNPQWLSLANELIAFPCSHDAIGEDGIEELAGSVHAAAPAIGRWWVSALKRANAVWSNPVRPMEPVPPAPIRAYQRAIRLVRRGVLPALERLHGFFHADARPGDQRPAAQRDAILLPQHPP